MVKRSVAILGATGSIGGSARAVIEEMRAGGAELQVEAITGASNVAALAQAALALRPAFVAIADERLAPDLKAACADAGVKAEIGGGASALEEAAARPSDWVLSAIVGAAAMAPTLAAVRRGAIVALANKECLVCAGALLKAEAAKAGARLLPVDSEHNAMFQVLTHPERVERLTLTASGGPFRTKSRAEMAAATPEQACAHPKWRMGPKISVDSATLMNKGLELIEAAYLFDMPEHRIDVLVHPESIVHSLVNYCDGSVLAQLSEPDMRVAIGYALAWPDRPALSTKRLDLAALGRLTFEAPNENLFPAIGLARAALRIGGGAPAALNAANEVAVAAFLEKRIGFLQIAAIVQKVLDALIQPGQNDPQSFAEIWAIDGRARALAGRMIEAAA